MDEKHLEMAEALESAQRASAIVAAHNASKPETHPDFDGEHCLDCGSDIPLGRLALGKVRCVLCQAAKEHRNAYTRK